MDHLIVFNSGSFTTFDARSKVWNWRWKVRGRRHSRPGELFISGHRNDTVAWQMPDSPNHLLKFNLSLRLVRDKLFAGRGTSVQRATGERSTTPRTLAASQLPCKRDAGAYGIVNLTLFSHKIIKISKCPRRLQTFWIVDMRIRFPFHVQALSSRMGRTFRLKLAYRF